MIAHNPYLHASVSKLYLSELHAQAEQDRLARLARGPRPVRRRIGGLLIVAGMALLDRTLDSPVPETG